MKNLIFIFLLFSLTLQAQKYKITRYEQKSDALFICINHKVKPVYIEHFFTEAERKDSISILHTIEGLVAELLIKADNYVDPEKFVNRINKAERMKTDSARIFQRKAALLARALVVKDSIAKVAVEAAKYQPVLNTTEPVKTDPPLIP